MSPPVPRVALILLIAATVPAAFVLVRGDEWTARAALLVLAGLTLASLSVLASRMFLFARLLIRRVRFIGQRQSAPEAQADRDETPTDAQRWMIEHGRGLEIAADVATAVGAIAIVVLAILFLPLD